MIRRVFVDTSFLLAIVNPRDPLHAAAVAVSNELASAHFVVTDYVLAEVLNYFSGRGARLHALAADMASELASNPAVERIVAEKGLFERALIHYRDRLDKDWSLTDCVSFIVMNDMSIESALTADRNFEQAGFRALLRNGATR